MRHRKHKNSLGLSTGHRRALLSNLAGALFTHGRIKTTHAKAKAIRPYAEKLISLAKKGDLHARRQAISKLRHRDTVARLFHEIAPLSAERAGGYTRIIKAGFRNGDAAPMAIIELVDYKFDAATETDAAPKEEKEATES